jgi:hypothetical protein
MKYLILGFLLSLFVGCTDTQLASIGSYGSPAHIKCFSGSTVIYEGDSTGKVATVQGSDGWEFKDATNGHFIRVSGPCVIVN